MSNKTTLTLDSISCPYCNKSQQSITLESDDDRNKMSLTNTKNTFLTNCWCCDESFNVIIENKVTIITKVIEKSSSDNIKIVKTNIIEDKSEKQELKSEIKKVNKTKKK
jgi:hypothetical protein